MLAKLVKYDLKWTYKVLLIFYILTLIFAFIGRGLSYIDNSFIFEFLSKFSCGVSVSFMFSILINNLMRLWARFIQNIYKDESYLTHTLPVKKSDIYFSKVISTIITLFTSVVIIVLGLVICYYGEGLIEFLKTFITEATFSVIVYCLIVLFLEILFIVFLGYLAIVIGYRSNHLKFVKSLIWAFGLYMTSSCISLLVILILGIFNKGIMDVFITNSGYPSMDVVKVLLVAASVIYVVYICVVNILTNRLLKKGVNVD